MWSDKFHRRIISLIVAFFAFLSLILLHVSYLVYVLFLPHISSLRPNESCYNCSTSHQQLIIENIPPWYFLASPKCVSYVCVLNLIDTLAYLFWKNWITNGVPNRNGSESAENTINSFVSERGVISGEPIEDSFAYFASFFQAMIFMCFNYQCALKKQCMPITGLFQLIALLSISGRCGIARRMNTLMFATETIPWYTCVYPFIAFVFNKWNFACFITLFYPSAILKAASAFKCIFTYFLSTKSVLFDDKSIYCSATSPCPLEQIIFAEYLHLKALAYIARTYIHWKGIKRQKHLQENDYENPYLSTENIEPIYQNFDAGILAFFVLRPFYERFFSFIQLFDREHPQVPIYFYCQVKRIQ